VSGARRFARQLVESFGRNLPLDVAAQVAYFAILAMFPCAMFLLTVLGYLPLRGLDQQIVRSLYAVLPVELARLLETTLREIVGQHRGWLLVSTLLFAIWSASDAASGLITALNRAYDVPETRSPTRIRACAVLVTIGSGIQLLVATTAMMIGPGLVHRIWSTFGLGGAFDRIWALLRVPVALLAMMLMLACVYYFLPNVKLRFRFFTPGAIVAVLSWLALSLGFRLWVSHFPSYARTYGALGTAILLLMWLYWSSVMIILGGEVNAIADRVRGIRHRQRRPGPPTVHDPIPGSGSRPRPAPRGPA
jgi:membrane protein